jgi:hypothetical protein
MDINRHRSDEGPGPTGKIFKGRIWRIILVMSLDFRKSGTEYDTRRKLC